MSAPNLICPKCGKALEWACWGDEGTAYCEIHQSRQWRVGQSSDDLCDFRCTVIRTGPDSVEMALPAGSPK